MTAQLLGAILMALGAVLVLGTFRMISGFMILDKWNGEMMKRATVILGVLTLFAPQTTDAGTIVDLRANFRLFGEVNRFSIFGFGDMFVSFGTNPAGGSTTGSEVGKIEYPPSGAPTTTGVLAPLSLPDFGWSVVDSTFSVPFTLKVDQGASMFIGLGTNFIGSAAGASGSKQVIFDFSDNIFFGGSPLGFTHDQGLSLQSVTLADGTPLADAGLKFEFIRENTVLSAFASAVDDRGLGPQIDVQPGTADGAAVIPFPGTATAKLRGGFDAGIPTDALVDLDVNPEPDPYVYDVAGASIGGTDNVLLTRISQPVPPVPEPSTLVSGLLAVALASGYWWWRAGGRGKAAGGRVPGAADSVSNPPRPARHR